MNNASNITGNMMDQAPKTQAEACAVLNRQQNAPPSAHCQQGGQPSTIREQMLEVELFQLRRGAELMAEHILAQPAVGLEQVSEVRMVASQVMAARGTGSGA